METQVYAVREGDRRNTIYHQVKGIQKVIYESPTSERIIFNNGEIDLVVVGNELTVSSKVYLPEGKSKITNEYKKIIPNLSYLDGTKNDIIQKFTDKTLGVEMERQQIALQQNLKDYMDRLTFERKRKMDLERLAQFSRSMEGKEFGSAAS
jgi:hypothetical protein